MIPIFDYSKLKGLITERYGTQRAFAAAIGRSDTYVSLVLSGKSYLGQLEIDSWVDILEIKNEDIGLYFFTH